MENQNNRFTPKDISDGDLKFAIPVYQRLFAWRRNEIRKLLFDLKEHFGKNSSPYYIGMMTVISNNGKYDLIDGQQRFTVMMLIASELRKYDDRWDKFLKYEYEYENVCRLAFTARSADNNYMQQILATEPGAPKGYVNNEMDAAISCIQEFLKDPETDTDKVAKKYEFNKREEVESFAKNVFEHLTFFLAELPHEYLQHPASLNKYFEVMNSAGKGLEQHEILMVELLRKCEQKNQDTFTRIWKLVSQMDRPVIKRPEKKEVEEYAEMYEQQIAQYRSGKYSISESNSSQSVFAVQTIDAIIPNPLDRSKEQMYESHEDGLLTFPELLLLVLDLTLDEEKRRPGDFSPAQFYRKDKLLSNFERYKVENVEAFYHRLLFVRTILDYYVVRRDFVDGQGSYKLIYRAGGDTDTRARLRQYQSMLYVSTDFYHWLKPFVQYLMQGVPNDARAILKKLKEIDKDLHKMPDAADWAYGKIDRYWFWRLDYCLWDRRDELFKNDEMNYADIVERYVFRENRSIEHLHPQDPSHNEPWPEDDVNSFGNLAMISQSFNSTQSNDHIQVKFARIQEQIGNKALQSIKLLKMCMDAKFEHTNWTPELAKQHKEKMMGILSEDMQDIESNQ